MRKLIPLTAVALLAWHGAHAQNCGDDPLCYIETAVDAAAQGQARKAEEAVAMAKPLIVIRDRKRVVDLLNKALAELWDHNTDLCMSSLYAAEDLMRMRLHPRNFTRTLYELEIGD